MRDFNKLSKFEIDMLLNWFLYNMSMETRMELSKQFPDIYQRLYNTYQQLTTRLVCNNTCVHLDTESNDVPF